MFEEKRRSNQDSQSSEQMLGGHLARLPAEPKSALAHALGTIDEAEATRSELRNSKLAKTAKTFEELKKKDFSLLSSRSIANADQKDTAHGPAKRRNSREIYREMSKAELEILSIKNKDNQKIKANLKRTLQENDPEHERDQQQQDEEQTKPLNSTSNIEDVLYRVVIPHSHPNLDAHKSHFEVMREVYDHTENKTDLSRNMLAKCYVQNPYRFKDDAKDIHNVLKNDISWPQGYIPEELKVEPFKVPKTKEDLFRQYLREKHDVKMAPLNKMYIDEAIQDLTKVCQTSNAYSTYKIAGWKVAFAKFKSKLDAERQQEDLELRAKLEKDLPPKLRRGVSNSKFASDTINHTSPRNVQKRLHKDSSKFHQYRDGQRTFTDKKFGQRNPSNDMSAFAYTSAMDFCIPEKFQDEEELDETDQQSRQSMYKSNNNRFGQSNNIESIQNLGAQMSQLELDDRKLDDRRAQTNMSMHDFGGRSPKSNKY